MVEISVCVGSSCHLRGSYPIIEELKRLIAIEHLENTVELKAHLCTNDCISGVCITVNGEKISNVSPKNIKEIFYEKAVPLTEDID